MLITDTLHQWLHQTGDDKVARNWIMPVDVGKGQGDPEG